MGRLGRHGLVCGAALWLAACGGGSGVTGTVLGTPYQVSDGFFLNNGSAATVFLSNDDNLCSEGQSDEYLQHAQVVLIGLAIVGDNGQSTFPGEPGTYQIGHRAAPGDRIAVVQALTVANCEFGSPAEAATGTVTLTATGAHFSGSVAALFADGSTLSGSFDADACPGDFRLLVQFCTGG